MSLLIVISITVMSNGICGLTASMCRAERYRPTPNIAYCPQPFNTGLIGSICFDIIVLI
ncbi:MAG: hypothetical protein KC615_03650 [Anaerolineae bacterium]|nr:hypothetical protein [Anaerolineae bacterium]